ncbi:YraN family protein [Candidatus Shapirobacteria bacterium]|nr:MAG: YraN family protein [Candidatus Shapirobacteria bacterium]
MKKYNYQKGRQGENIALVFLQKLSFELVEKNFQNKRGEIDLIMIDKNVLVFVEVKLKVGQDFGSPEDMISPRKIWRVRRIAESFLVERPNLAKKYPQQRIDAVCMVLEKDGQVSRINHYKNIGG